MSVCSSACAVLLPGAHARAAACPALTLSAPTPPLSQVGHLRQLLEAAPPAKRTAVLQHLTRCLQPVLEKALLHPPMTHRWGALFRPKEGGRGVTTGALGRFQFVGWWAALCVQQRLQRATHASLITHVHTHSFHTPHKHTHSSPRLVRELLEAAPGSVVADAVDTLAATGGSVLKMVHTHDGAAAACMALAYGTPRDRKRLVKGMKGAPRVLLGGGGV